MKKIFNQKGFTLLELLVVISIIGILIVLAAASYSVAQQRGRDARRRGDLKSMQNAFEQYYASNSSSYDANCATMANAMMPGGAPTDPQGGSYDFACSATAYCICATLDDSSGGNAGGRTGTSCNYSTGTSHYCVSNLQ